MLVEMAIKGLMIDPGTNMPIVILRDLDNQRALPIWAPCCSGKPYCGPRPHQGKSEPASAVIFIPRSRKW